MLLLLPLFLFSAYCPAQKVNIDSVKKELEKGIQDTNQVINYRIMAGVTSNTDPAKAVEYAKSGVTLGKILGFDKGVAGCYLNGAVSYSAAGKLDSAIIFIDTAITWAVKVGEPGRISLAYLNRADYKRQLGNMKEALKDCDTSMVYAEKANRDDTKARIYQTIGSVYHAQDDFLQGISYYEKAYSLYEKGGNKRMMAISHNNLANAYKHLKDYDKAITNFQKAIQLAGEANDEVSLPMYYSNMGDVYSEKGDYRQAEENGLKSLALAKEQENDIQIAQAQLVLSVAYSKMKRYEDAIRAGNEAYKLFTENELTDERQTVASVLAEAYYNAGRYKESYQFMQLSRDLADSVSREKFDEEVVNMQTSFKVAEKDKEIQLLAKDKELQKQKLQQQRWLMAGAAAIALLALAGIWLLVNRNRLRQRMKELELRNQIAADLHDEVGSSLSSIHMLSQMAAQPGTDEAQKGILEKMSTNAKETMDKMGDIVWMIKPGETEAGSLKQRMERFAYDICATKNIQMEMNLTSIEEIRLEMVQRKNIYLIFKEALNNAVKYSGTEKIEVKTSITGKQLELLVKDEGNGFDPAIVKRGNGLDNIRNRAHELNGQVTIDSSTGKGTTIKLMVPVAG